MRKGNSGERRKRRRKEKTDENSGHHVIASSRPPERRPLERLTLVPICDRIVSGGPLFTSLSGDGVTPGQNYEVIGVVSVGYGCGDPSFPGIFARVTDMMPWILKITSEGWETCSRT